MITLLDGRTELFQWDSNISVNVDGDCNQVHFSNKPFGNSIDVEVVDGTAKIPDILLQADKMLYAWAFLAEADGGRTKEVKAWQIIRRNKPSDYIFTEQEKLTWQKLKEEIDALEQDLRETEEELAKAIRDGDEALANALEEAVNTINDRITTVNNELSAAIAKVQTNLDDAVNTLNKTIADGDKANAEALAQAVQDLNTAIEEAAQAAQSANDDLEKKLVQKIEDADKALQDSLDALNEALTAETDRAKSAESENAAAAAKAQSDVDAVKQDLAGFKTNAADTYETKTDSTNKISTAISEHNTDPNAHNDIRLLISDINDRLNAFFDSDDATLDELSEIVEYIKSNKTLIDSITTSKVSVSDIIDNLTTNVANRPLSAAQGVVLKGLIDALASEVDGKEESGAAADALAQAKQYTDKETAKYLPLAGGGTVSSDNVSVTVFKRNVSGGGATIGFENGDGMLGYLGMNSASDEVKRLLANQSSWVTLLDANNFRNYADAKGAAETVKTELQSSINNASNAASAAQTAAENAQATADKKANSADIATTATLGISNSSTVYVKISDFGAWGTGAWNQKGFSMLITSRAGEMVWVAVSSDDSNTNAKAIRLLNTYDKILNVYYSTSESAVYVRAQAWCNNINAHILSNVKGDYVPIVAQASALASDAVNINIVEFGVNNNGTVVGDTSVPLALGGNAERPTYNGNNMALQSEVPSTTETWTFTLEDGSTVTKAVYVG